METRTYPITDDALALTVQSLEELTLRLETEASAFALLKTRGGRMRLPEAGRAGQRKVWDARGGYRPGKDGAGNPERSPPDGARDGSGRRKVRLYI